MDLDIRLLDKNVNIDFSFCKNTKANYNYLLKIGCSQLDGNPNVVNFPYLIIDENGDIQPLHKSVIPHCQYNKEIVFNKKKNKWEYALNSSQNMQ